VVTTENGDYQAKLDLACFVHSPSWICQDEVDRCHTILWILFWRTS